MNRIKEIKDIVISIFLYIFNDVKREINETIGITKDSESLSKEK